MLDRAQQRGLVNGAKIHLTCQRFRRLPRSHERRQKKRDEDGDDADDCDQLDKGKCATARGHASKEYRAASRNVTFSVAALHALRGEELPFIELLIGRARPQQLVVLPLPHDLAAVHHHDRVGGQDRAEAVGDDERRSVVHE
jgi:hypothetical protein